MPKHHGAGPPRILNADDTGVLYPAIPLQARDSSLTVIQNQATFGATSWWAGIPVIHANAIACSVGWVTDSDAAGVGEIRLVLKATPNTPTAVTAASAAVSLAGNATGTQVFNWIHGQELNTGPWYFGVQTRRVSGSGNVSSYCPNYIVLIEANLVSATPSGL